MVMILAVEAVVTALVCLAVCRTAFVVEFRRPCPPIPAVRPYRGPDAAWQFRTDPARVATLPAPRNPAWRLVAR